MALARRVGDAFELVFDPSASIRMLVTDHGVPQSGVQVDMRAVLKEYAIERRFSDAEGRLVFESLGAGEYMLEVCTAGYWSEAVMVSAEKEGAERTLRAYRLASAELTLVNSAGARVSGVDIELAHREFNVDVAQWMASGRVPSGSLRSDSHGVIRVDGVPNGEFRWSAGGVQGAVRLAPASVNRFQLQLP
jgi:5-hydroxyisourate hydrolase-like protein (transthyretin family)